ncbi:MAG: hypothetical protein KME64_41525 [Scytonematopsis contorta HA4267-MV1]|jgi:hypothetical protein|nr:hypothetical protein [Scytonematopsis contorta HA4267-MV1]
MDENKEKEKYAYARLPLDERLQQFLATLPDSWESSMYTGWRKRNAENRRLRNLVEFAVLFLHYLQSNQINLPEPDEFDNFLAMLPWSEGQVDDVIVGAKIKELAVSMNLPVPNSKNVNNWFSTLIESGTYNTVGQTQVGEQVSFETNVFDYLTEIISSKDATIKIDNKNDLNLFINQLFYIYFSYRNLVANLVERGVPEPSGLEIQEWLDKYIKPDNSLKTYNNNSSDELLEYLINLESLPSEEEMVFIANKYKVRTRQLYRIYYMIHGTEEILSTLNEAETDTL